MTGLGGGAGGFPEEEATRLGPGLERWLASDGGTGGAADSPAPRLGLGAAEHRLREAAGPEQAPGPAPALRGFQAVSSTRGGVLRARRPDAASRTVSFVT